MLRVPAEDIPNKGLIYLIPGNPGLSGFYSDFLQELHNLRPGYEIMCGDHLGMDLDLNGIKEYDTIPQVYSLDEQVKHHADNIAHEILSLASPSGNAKPFHVVLMGHSMGSFLLQRVVPLVVEACEKGGIQPKLQVFLLTPTIHDISKSPNGKKLTFLMRFLNVARILAFLAYYLPTKILEAIVRIRLASSLTQSGLSTAMSMVLRPKIIYQMCGLAALEMVEITDSNYEPFWSWAKPPPGSANNLNTVTMILCRSDHWVGTKTTNYLLRTYSQLPHVLMEVQDDIPHSFCLRHSLQVATRVVECMWP